MAPLTSKPPDGRATYLSGWRWRLPGLTEDLKRALPADAIVTDLGPQERGMAAAGNISTKQRGRYPKRVRLFCIPIRGCVHSTAHAAPKAGVATEGALRGSAVLAGIALSANMK